MGQVLYLIIRLLKRRLPVHGLSLRRYLEHRGLSGFVADGTAADQSALGLLVHLLGELAVRVGQVEQRLDDLRSEDLVLLPQVEDSDDFTLKEIIEALNKGSKKTRNIEYNLKYIVGIKHSMLSDKSVL